MSISDLPDINFNIFTVEGVELEPLPEEYEVLTENKVANNATLLSKVKEFALENPGHTVLMSPDTSLVDSEKPEDNLDLVTFGQELLEAGVKVQILMPLNVFESTQDAISDLKTETVNDLEKDDPFGDLFGSMFDLLSDVMTKASDLYEKTPDGKFFIVYNNL